MMLFSRKKRTSKAPKPYAEPDYEYLDRSARPEAAKVRALLTHWYNRYPEGEKRELKARIQSEHFASATFELLLFAVSTSLGFKVAVHADVPHSTARPDFLLTDPSDRRAYLECVLCSDMSDRQRAAEARKNVVLDAINDVESPFFYLGIDIEGDPATPPKAKLLRTDLGEWLAGLDPDQAQRDFDSGGTGSLPQLVWEHDGWRIKFEAFPKAPERRGASGRVILSVSPEAQLLDTWESMRDAVVRKGNQYGDMAEPMIVAVNVGSLGIDREDEMQALFGEVEFVIDPNNLARNPEMRRRPNGAWFGPKGLRYTRISGVWFFDWLTPWNVATRNPTLYQNPWATRTIPHTMLPVTHARAEENKIRWYKGKTLAEILNLPTGWPK